MKAAEIKASYGRRRERLIKLSAEAFLLKLNLDGCAIVYTKFFLILVLYSEIILVYSSVRGFHERVSSAV